MELIDIFKILRRWAWVIITIVVVTHLALLVGLILSKPMYEAQVKLQFSTPQQGDVAVYDQYRSVNTRDEITVARNNFQIIIESDVVKDRAFAALNLDREKVNYDLEVVTENDSDFVHVVVRARTAILAAGIANALVDQAIDNFGELRAKPTIDEQNLYAAQLQDAEEAYRKAEDSFASFKEQNNIGVLSQEITTLQQLLEQLQSQRDQWMLEVNSQDSVARVEDLIAQRRAELDRLLALQPMYLVLEQNYTNARDQYRIFTVPGALESGRVLAEQNFRNAGQAFTDYKKANGVTSLPDEITGITQQLQSLELQLDQRLMAASDQEAAITQIDSLIRQRKQDLDRLSSLQSNYNVLEQKTTDARDKYQRILSKLTEAELKATVVRAANFIQIIEPASEPLAPVNTTTQLLVLGILGSLGLGVLAAFLLEYLTHSGDALILPENAGTRTVLGLPVLGRMPLLDDSFYEANSPEEQSVRQLRANILLSPRGSAIKTLLVTSPQPGDGKTLTTANLGAVMADGKTRIVIIDADLRNPVLHKTFNQPNPGGLGDLLEADEADLDKLLTQYLRTTDIAGLSLLTAGRQPDDPSLRLTSERMSLILKALADRFDFMLIDSPPFSIAPDSTILAKYTDGILLIICPGKTSQRVAEETISSFAAIGANVIGVALNRTSLDQTSYRYYNYRRSKASTFQRVLDAIPFFKAPQEHDLLSLDQASDLLGVQKKTVLQWCQAGDLKATRINFRWWVRREDLQDFLKNRYGSKIPV